MVRNKQSSRQPAASKQADDHNRQQTKTGNTHSLLYGLYTEDMAKISWLPSLWALLRDRAKRQAFSMGPTRGEG